MVRNTTHKYSEKVDRRIVDNKIQSVRELVFLATTAACAEKAEVITLM